MAEKVVKIMAENVVKIVAEKVVKIVAEKVVKIVAEKVVKIIAGEFVKIAAEKIVKIVAEKVVKIVAEKHAVPTRGHRAATTPLRQVVPDLFSCFQIERPLIRVKRIPHNDRMLKVPTVMSLHFLVMILPKKSARRQD